MRKLADAERHELQARRDRLEEEIRLALLPKDAMDDHNAILEIRAGTGGDEAALFAGDLFRMYERYAAKQSWKTEILSLSEGTKGAQGDRRRGAAAAAYSPSSSSSPACTAYSACLTRKRQAVSTHLRPLSPFCPKSKMSISTSTRLI